VRAPGSVVESESVSVLESRDRLADEKIVKERNRNRSSQSHVEVIRLDLHLITSGKNIPYAQKQK
jgi:hypothetical protein